jgi:hypothetical protein
MSEHEPIDEKLMAKLMQSVRITFRVPMQLKVTRRSHGKETDSHTFEVAADAEVGATQKTVQAVVLKWKGGFKPGDCYVLERVA